jgi:hypothetical protein
MTRRPRGHSAPCIQQTLGRPLRHAQDRRNNIGHEEHPFIAPPAPVPDLDATLAVEGASRGEGDEPSPSVPVINIEIIRRKAHPLTGLDRRTRYQNEAVGAGSCVPDHYDVGRRIRRRNALNLCRPCFKRGPQGLLPLNCAAGGLPPTLDGQAAGDPSADMTTLIPIYFFEFLSMGKTFGPRAVSEETSTWWGNLPTPRLPGGRKLCGCCGSLSRREVPNRTRGAAEAAAPDVVRCAVSKEGHETGPANEVSRHV